MAKPQMEILEDFFKSVELTDDPIMLNEATMILNQKKFVDSHLTLLKANAGKKAMMPYYHRLVGLYKILNQK